MWNQFCSTGGKCNDKLTEDYVSDIEDRVNDQHSIEFENIKRTLEWID